MGLAQTRALKGIAMLRALLGWKTGVVCVVLLGGVWWWFPRKDIVQYDTWKVDQGDVLEKVTASGVLAALVTVQVGSQVSGRVQRLFVDYNSVVKKGDVLAILDPALFEAAYDQARANVLALEGDLKSAEAKEFEATKQLARMKHLAEQKMVGEAELDNATVLLQVAQAQVVSAKGRIAQAQAQLKQTRTNLSYTVITSPVNGVVVTRAVDVGQTVAASLQAPVLFVIVEDLKRMQVDTSVAESDIGRLREGMEALFTVDAYPEKTFKGVVRQIRHAPQTVQNVVTYNAVIDVNNESLLLKPGMTANTTLVSKAREGVVRVSHQAMRFQAPMDVKVFQEHPCVLKKEEKAVWVLREKTPWCVGVRTGLSDGSYSEELSGNIHVGDVLLVDATVLNKKRQTPSSSGGGGPMRRVF
jgi:HlyD family secretion protein